ncbi:MAG: glycosyltransferase [Alphaproteobacteria bacterium]|nr:glycosyltransferase [Alphaproteobacteria bacterium]MBU0803239.1 glycosyltransferase [Alphaproteobacteria bacterium]MBU0873927.1 glycosyltransferase [Alphaproteobacteria bacterium]MBU1400573.1 glycosyltransferase [Alphaproteobacteria bacterium]MBU1590446.1 glycosyltransferase [Alphaproteobacteria bacterium]
MTTSEQVAAEYFAALQAFSIEDFEQADSIALGVVDRAERACLIRRVGSARTSTFSVVVVSHRTTERFMEGIRSLAEASKQLPEAEFVFVSNDHNGLAAILNEHFSDFVLVEVGFNFGCSGGRNLGVRVAQSDIIVFVDDDGLTTSESIRNLVAPFVDSRLVAVRGQAAPFEGQSLPGHYKPAERPIPRFIDLEGMSAWKKGPFLEAQGFNVLLAGHEGIDLTYRLVPIYGHNAFRYEPSALLQHDFAPDPSGLEAKRERQEKSKRYLLHRGVDLGVAVRAFNSVNKDTFQTAVYASSNGHQPASQDRPISACFLTTVKNGSQFVEDHRRSLTRQTDPNFTVVVVDDHSDDGSREAIERAWHGDDRLRIVESVGHGRAAALNTGIKHCDSEIILIADIDDISLPHRLAETKKAFVEDPALDYLGFLIFTDSQYVRLGRPSLTAVWSMCVRALFGMPAPFPAFALRSSGFTSEFNTQLVAGIDYDWLTKQLRHGRIGKLKFEPMVYYRTHDQQITSCHGSRQREVGKSTIIAQFESLMERKLSREEKDTALRLAGWLPCTTEDQVSKMEAFAYETFAINASTFMVQPAQLEMALTWNISESRRLFAIREAKRAQPTSHSEASQTDRSLLVKSLRRLKNVVKNPRLLARVLEDPTVIWR